MKVAIVFPHVGYCTGWRPHLATTVESGATYHIAQALTYLYSICREFTRDVRVFDFNFLTFEDNTAALERWSPDKILISSTMNSYDSTKEIAQAAARRLPGVEIFIGGPAVSTNYYLRPKLLDVGVPVQFIVTNKDIFAWSEQVFGRRAAIDFAEFTPTNAWIAETYPADAIENLRFTVITSLGCTYKCSFCLNPKVYDLEYKHHDVLRREVEELKSLYGATRISFADPYFFMNMRLARARMDIMRECGVQWSQQTCLVTLTDDNLQKMADTGCTSVLVGIENFASAEIDKPVGAAELEDRLRVASQLGIKIKPSFISGLADIDYASDVQQIKYIRSLIDRGLIENHQLQSNIYSPYIPDHRDRLLDVPFRFWGVMPVTASDDKDLQANISLCDQIYDNLFPETKQRYAEVRAEYLSVLGGKDDIWLKMPAVPVVTAKQLTKHLTTGKLRVLDA